MLTVRTGNTSPFGRKIRIAVMVLGLEREVAIVRVRAPEVSERLGRQVAEVTQRLRGLDLYKVPGVAETVDWARALAALGHTEATPAALRETMGAAIKHQEDLERSEEAIAEHARR